MKIKLAEALLRRKELQEKVDQLRPVKDSNVFYQIRGQRNKITDGIDELNADYPKLEIGQVTAEYDYYARALRLIDGYIQQMNWTAEIEVTSQIMDAYKA